MKKAGRIILGVVFVIVGVVFALNALDITNIELLFDGWWTLFIIIPCAIGLFTEREKTGNLIGLTIGVCLLLVCRDIISFSTMWKFLGPAIIVIFGLKLIFGGILDRKVSKTIEKLKKKSSDKRECYAIFSGSDLKPNGEKFDGASLKYSENRLAFSDPRCYNK